MDNPIVTFERGVWAEYEECLGDYVMSFEAKLQKQCGETYKTIGTAWVILTDEKWVSDLGDVRLVDRVHMDFNDERNYNDYTLYEYLEDTLHCTNYGSENGTYGKIARILKILIDENYRGNGYFFVFFDKLLRFVQKFEADFAAVMPYPFGYVPKSNKHENEKDEERLQNFYARFGFVPCHNEGHPYMKKDMKRI